MTDEEELRDLRRPEGRLLGIALVRDGRSARQFAPVVDLSDARLRQIVNGYQSVGGHPVPVIAPAATLARIAVELKIRPEKMREAGRADAAEIMDGLLEEQDVAVVSADPQDVEYVAAPGDRSDGDQISARELRDELRAIRAVLERMEQRDRSSP